MKKSISWMLAVVVVTALGSPLAAGEITLISPGSTWLYLDDGSDQGSAWRQPGFDDSAWLRGPAQLGYGDGDEVTLVRCRPTTPVASPCDQGGFDDRTITTYFRREFLLRDAHEDLALLRLSLLFDDGAVVYLNGEEQMRVNLPMTQIRFDTLATAAAVPDDEFQEFFLDPAALVEGVNVIAVEVHQQSRGSTDVSFDVGLFVSDDDLPDVERDPYLQRATPSSAVLRWRTTQEVTSRIDINTVPSPTGAETTIIPDLRVNHVVTLEDLPAGQRLYYAIGSDDGMLFDFDPERFFLTPAPAGSSPPIRVWAIGDSGTPGPGAVAVRDAYRRYLAGRDTDVWIMLGDNADPQGTLEDYEAAVFDAYPQLLRNTFLWPTLGDHDLRSADSDEESGPYFELFILPTDGESGGVASGTEAYYSFDIGNIHFISLDSAGSSLSAAGPMLGWLAADVAATAQEWIVAYWHHPPYTKGSHDSDNATASGGRSFNSRLQMVPILEAAGVDLVLGGQSHSYERSFLLNGHYGLSSTLAPSMVLDDGDGDPAGDGAYFKDFLGTVYAVAGSSSRTSEGGALNHPAMAVARLELGSLVLEVEGQRLDGRFINSDGAVRDRFTLIKEARPQLTAIAPDVVAEGSIATVTVELDRAPLVAVSVDYATAGQTATAGADFTAVSGTLVIPAGETSASVDVATLVDGAPEDAETFAVVFSNIRNAALGQAQAVVTIDDSSDGGNPCPDCPNVVCLPHLAVGLPSKATAAERASVFAKIDRPSAQLFAPFYEVDVDDPSGQTTLYAVRNLAAEPASVDLSYLDKLGVEMTRQTLSLAAGATTSINLRDVAGLGSDGDGFARGLVAISSSTPLGGDFFQVDVGDRFAAGDRLFSFDDFCSEGEIRFLDFGSGTRLAVFVGSPQGTDPKTTNAAFSVTAISEDGTAGELVDCFTDQILLQLDAAFFTDESFGTLAFQFPGAGGYVYAEYSAGGRYSVGVNWACTEPEE